MIAFDTNLLVRYITKDDEAQFNATKALISRYAGKKHSIYINKIVLCELVWVLKSGYEYNRSQISDVLNVILSIEEFIIEDDNIVLEAILLYEHGLADFSDYLIYLKSKKIGCEKVYSFDQGGIKSLIFEKLE